MKVIAVDDHPLARKGLKAILSESKSIAKVIEASSIKDALEMLHTEKPIVAIIDLKLGDENGLELIEQAKKKGFKTKFIILTSFISKDEFIIAEDLGVDGYVLKEATIEDIVFIVDSVVRGKKYYDPGIVMYCKEANSVTDNRIEQLSKREMEVLSELGKGFSNEEIANHLFISVNTVKKHVSSILSKLSLGHRTQAALFVQNTRL